MRTFSWQKRGHASHNGGKCANSFIIGGIRTSSQKLKLLQVNTINYTIFFIFFLKSTLTKPNTCITSIFFIYIFTLKKHYLTLGHPIIGHVEDKIVVNVLDEWDLLVRIAHVVDTCYIW